MFGVSLVPHHRAGASRIPSSGAQPRAGHPEVEIPPGSTSPTSPTFPPCPTLVARRKARSGRFARHGLRPRPPITPCRPEGDENLADAAFDIVLRLEREIAAIVPETAEDFAFRLIVADV